MSLNTSVSNTPLRMILPMPSDKKPTYPPPEYPGRQQQPEAQPTMTIPQAEGESSRHASDAVEPREWSHRLFDCFSDYKTCTCIHPFPLMLVLFLMMYDPP